MRSKLLLLLLLAGGSIFAGTHVSIGIGVGLPYAWYPPPPPPVYYAPPCPGPEYVWIPGYYYRVGPSWTWRAGYWAPPYGRAYGVRTRSYGGPAFRQGFRHGGHGHGRRR